MVNRNPPRRHREHREKLKPGHYPPPQAHPSPLHVLGFHVLVNGQRVGGFEVLKLAPQKKVAAGGAIDLMPSLSKVWPCFQVSLAANERYWSTLRSCAPLFVCDKCWRRM